MTTLLLSLVGGYVLFGALLYGCQRSLLYHPNQAVPDPAEFEFRDVQSRRVATSDGFELLVWWRLPKRPDGTVIVYFHGNAGHLGHRAEKVRPFLQAGHGLLLVSYRYNAEAGGSPAEAGLYEDGRAAFRFLRQMGVKDQQIVVYGESLGTAIAVTMAAENKIGAVVLEAPYTSIADVAEHHYWYLPTNWLLKDRFDMTEKIRRVQAPLLIVHGERDSIIPMRFGRALYDLANEPKEGLFIPEAGHNDLHAHQSASRVLDFLDRIMADPSR